jgi:hypothetical protein
MTTTPGAPDAAAIHDAIVATNVRRSGNRLLVRASEAVVLVGALWLVVLVLPYLAGPDGTNVALVDDGPLRASTVGPRVIGVVISAAAAALGLALPRWRAALFCTAGSALASLAAYSVWWAFAVRTGFGVPTRIGWWADLAVSAAAVATVAAGALGVWRSVAGQPRPLDRRLLPSTPYVAVAAGTVAVATDWLLGRDPLFLTAYALGSGALDSRDITLGVRVAALSIALLVIVLPVLAAFAPERRIGEGLAVGWLAAIAVPASRPLLTTGYTVEPEFALGLVLAGLTTIALLVWLALTGRTTLHDPPPTRHDPPVQDDEPPPPPPPTGE